MKLLACGRCGWVHMGRLKAEVEEEVRAFNDFFHRATADVKACYNGLSSIEHYKKCFRCGAPHTEMRPAADTEVPCGSTIQPILEPEWN